MKHFYLLAFFLLSITTIRAQDKIGFKYKFVSDNIDRSWFALPLPEKFRIRQGKQLDSSHLNALEGLFLVKDFPQKKIVVPGNANGQTYYALRNAAPPTKPAPEDIEQLFPKGIYSLKLVGSIARKDGDTLFLSFRPIVKNADFDAMPLAVNANNTNNEEDFIYIIGDDQWARPWFFYTQKARFRVPFAYTSLAATAIPLRLSLRKDSNGKAVSEFPTANLALFRVWGRELIYQDAGLDEAKSRFFGLGPFVGPTLVTTTAAAGSEGRLGIVYGVNAVVGLGGVNLIFAQGWESSWSENADKFSPWLGFGIGLKLVELSGGATSENK